MICERRGTENMKMSSKRKSGCIDLILEKLPEMHIRGYSYCGPNTNLENRLARDESGINELDRICKEHDIAYTENTNLASRCKADKLLVLKAFRRVYAKDSRIGERITALFVSMLISVKVIISKLELCITRVGHRVRTQSNKKKHRK